MHEKGILTFRYELTAIQILNNCMCLLKEVNEIKESGMPTRIFESVIFKTVQWISTHFPPGRID
jgi:hypothetical protein